MRGGVAMPSSSAIETHVFVTAELTMSIVHDRSLSRKACEDSVEVGSNVFVR